MKTSIRMTASLVVILALLNITEEMSLGGMGSDLRCRCIKTEKRRIGKHILTVKIFPPTSHCKDTEIIAILKKSKQTICLDINTRWVRRLVERMKSS
ncbi:C-X-C motif chemokine 2-like precursor [Esox lucius]|uniref:Interleukin-8 n=1 Tax=Esox lucius TaxID=8010 RepID=C1BY18_ESOLU|nr:C-X-C motif chemokine 2-like precursor [Esox lucius]ACO13921.1 Interleukin-8 precursor [Esox lucius]